MKKIILILLMSFAFGQFKELPQYRYDYETELWYLIEKVEEKTEKFWINTEEKIDFYIDGNVGMKNLTDTIEVIGRIGIGYTNDKPGEKLVVSRVGSVGLMPIGFEPTEELNVSKNITIPLFNPDDFISKIDILNYVEECYNDTLILDEMLICETNQKKFKELFNIEVKINSISTFNYILSSNGYRVIKYDKNGNVYFIKEPTFEGFIEWLGIKL